jgi:CRISPR/Cas system-associated protein Csm6
MEKLFVTTVGTSLITGTGILQPEQVKLIMKDSLVSSPSPEVATLLASLEASLAADHTPIFRTAEFATLLKYQQTVDPTASQWFVPGSLYVFVGTDTYLGKFVVNVFRSLLQKHYPTIRLTNDIVIPGLNVGVAGAYDTAQWELFRSLNTCTAPYVARETPDNVIFNATGGFKFVSGWIHTYATLNGHRVMYLFEGSSEILLTKPAMKSDFPPKLHV